MRNGGDQGYDFGNTDSPLLPQSLTSPLELKGIDTTEIGKRLGALLGHELLYFEFIDSLLLYLLLTDRVKLHYEQMRKVLAQLLLVPAASFANQKAARKRWLGTETDRKEYDAAKRQHYMRRYEELRAKVNDKRNPEEAKLMKENDIDIIKLMEANAAAEKKRKSKQPPKKPAAPAKK